MNRSSVVSTAVVWRLTVTLLATAWLLVLTQQRALRLTSTVGSGAPTVDPGMLAGVALVLASAICVALGSPARVSLLALMTGVVWAVPWFIPLEASDIRRVVATLVVGAAPLQLALLLSLIVQVTRGRGAWSKTVDVTAVLLGLAVALAIVSSLTWDPFLAPNCLRGCDHAPPLIDAGVSGRMALRTIGDTLSLLLGLWLVVVSVPILAIRPSTAGPVVVAVGGTLVGLASIATAGEAFLRSATPATLLPGQERDLLALLWLSVAIGAMAVALGVVLLALRGVTTRRRVRDVARSIESAPAPGTLATALGAALHDQTLVVAFWLQDEGVFVDSAGRPFATPSAEDRASTIIERDGEPIAFVGHRPGLDPETLTAELGPSVLVALDNERLSAARLAQLRELQASRARVVAVEDAERRRIERDLHDGAQQRLLAILMDLRTAHQAASRTGDAAVADALAGAGTQAQATIDELRRVAHGVYPVVLGEAGLLPALWSLADEAPVPLSIESFLSGRSPETTEAAAYEVVSEALGAAHRGGGSGLNVELRMDHDVIRMGIGCDVRLGSVVVERVRDRVGAAGGSVVAEMPEAGGTLLQVELPCA